MAPFSNPRSPAAPSSSSPEGGRGLKIAIWVAALAASLAAFDLARNTFRLLSPPDPEEVASAASRAVAPPRATRVQRFGTEDPRLSGRGVFDPHASSPFIDPAQPRPATVAVAPASPPPQPPPDESDVLREMYASGAMRQISAHQADMLADMNWLPSEDSDPGERLAPEEIERIRRGGLIIR